MVTKDKRKDTAVRISKWLDKEVEAFLKDKKAKIQFPSKRNFVDMAVMQLLEKKGVDMDK